MLRLKLPTEARTISLGVPGCEITFRPVLSLDRDAANIVAGKYLREAESAGHILSVVLGREVTMPPGEEDRRALGELLSLAEICRRAVTDIKGVERDGKELTVDEMTLANWLELLMDPIRKELVYFGMLEATALLESEGNALPASSNGGSGEAGIIVQAAGV